MNWLEILYWFITGFIWGMIVGMRIMYRVAMKHINKAVKMIDELLEDEE
jgi:uncharacterized protein YneF (UPF0154 family)